jgi:hypothetical protein
MEILRGAPGVRPTFSTALLVVNPLFVGLLWSKFRSLRWQPRPTRLVAALTYVGATLILALVLWAWSFLLSSVADQL